MGQLRVVISKCGGTELSTWFSAWCDLTVIYRCTVVVKHDDREVVGVGDSAIRKNAETLAALSALYQLDTIGAVGTSNSHMICTYNDIRLEA